MKKAFTLIEVTFAVAIILIFLGSLIAISNVSSKNVVVSLHRLEAANQARLVAEVARQVKDTGKLQNIPWATMNNSCWLPGSLGGGVNHPVASCGGRSFGFTSGHENLSYADGTVFTRQATITNITGSIKKIDAQVSWTDFGQTHSVIMTTYLTDH
jgi:prepilin-type N-terminal cleavage/methylation domain-containing protein